jgi:membrane associated rhomboid family serine protease
MLCIAISKGYDRKLIGSALRCCPNPAQRGAKVRCLEATRSTDRATCLNRRLSAEDKDEWLCCGLNPLLPPAVLLAAAAAVNTVKISSGRRWSLPNQEALRVQSKEPIFNAPGAVLAFIAAMAAVHAGRHFLLSPEANEDVLLALAFIPTRYSGFTADIPGGELAKYTSFLTHIFVHADLVHLTVNSVWFLAFGSVVCRRLGAFRFLLFATCGGMAGAAAFLFVHPSLPATVIGASGAVATLMGGVMRFLFNAIDSGQGYLLRDDPAGIPRMSLATALKDRRVVLATIVFVAVNLLAIVGFGKFGTVSAIAWEAHLGGYFFGLLAFALFDTALRKPSLYGGEVE